MHLLYPGDVLRAGDQAPLGNITAHQGAFQATRTQVASGTPALLEQEFATLDAAVAWIAINPYVPACAHRHGVYGPELARWGALSMVGCLYAPHHPAVVQAAVLVVLNPNGQVVATLRSSPKGWNLVIQGPTPIRRHRAQLPKALRMFRAEVIQNLVTGSMHEKMQMLAHSAAMDPVATTFVQTRAEHQAARHEVSPIDGPVADCIIHETPVIRKEDDFPLGAFWTEGGPVFASRHQIGEPPEVQAHASFDAALAWIQASPFAPDLARFPVHHRSYGPVLWSMPNITVIGHVGDSYLEPDPRRAPLYVMDRDNVRIGMLTVQDGAWTIHLARTGLGMHPVSTHATKPDALGALCQVLIREQHHLLSKDRTAALQAEVPDASARMSAFIQDWPRLVQDFRAGTGPTA